MSRNIFVKVIDKIVHTFVNLYCKNKVVVYVEGGGGSQIGQYLVGQSIKALNPKIKVFYDISWFKKDGKSLDGKDNRNFDLCRAFENLDFDEASDFLTKVTKRFFYVYNNKCYLFDKELLLKNPAYQHGFFSNKGFVLPGIKLSASKMIFSSDIVEKVEKKYTIENPDNSVVLHIRRGDYIGSVLECVTVNYFITAINDCLTKISNPLFYVFSLDKEFFENEILPNLNQKINFLYCDFTNDEAFESIYLMTKINNYIISNSSFSYGACLLNQNRKISYMPKLWRNDIDNPLTEGMESAFDLEGSILIDN